MKVKRSPHSESTSFVKRTSSVLLALSLLFALQVTAQRTSPEPGRTQRDKQTHFGAEEPITHPAEIPNVVLQLLRQDERVQQCFEDAAHQESDITSWFTASAVDLNDDHQPDLVVKPEKACLQGANIVSFWVFRRAGNDYKLALKTHSLSLSILRTKTNGYRDISVGAASAVMFYGTTYKFDGQRYKPRECWEESLGEAKSKATYFKCSENTEKPYR